MYGLVKYLRFVNETTHSYIYDSSRKASHIWNHMNLKRRHNHNEPHSPVVHRNNKKEKKNK